MNKVQKWWDKEIVRVVTCGFVGVLVWVLMCMGGLSFIVDQSYCTAKTADIGFAHRWGFWKGCQIEVTEGQWMPLESYRYTSPID